MLFVSVLVSCLGLIFTVTRAGRAPSQRPHSLSMGKMCRHIPGKSWGRDRADVAVARPRDAGQPRPECPTNKTCRVFSRHCHAGDIRASGLRGQRGFLRSVRALCTPGAPAGAASRALPAACLGGQSHAPSRDQGLWALQGPSGSCHLNLARCCRPLSCGRCPWRPQLWPLRLPNLENNPSRVAAGRVWPCGVKVQAPVEAAGV